MLVLLAAVSSAHRIPRCTRRAGAPAAARLAAVRCQLPAVAAANACTDAAVANPLLSYEMVQGADVVESSALMRTHPPTCLLTHGILGSRRNLKSFAQRMALDFPQWQFLLVDLRCHGQTSARTLDGPNTVEAAALDVIALLNHLKIYPVMLMGHSFGGKVVMSMVQQSGRVMPRPVQVWVLDTVPGDVWCDGGDHPRDTIRFVSTLEPPFASRKVRTSRLTPLASRPSPHALRLTPLGRTQGAHRCAHHRGLHFRGRAVDGDQPQADQGRAARLDVRPPGHQRALRLVRAVRPMADARNPAQGAAGGTQPHTLKAQPLSSP